MVPTTNGVEKNHFSKKQMDQIIRLLNSNSSSDIPYVSLVQIGSHHHALFCCSDSASWIINSSVSDHMTNHSYLFTNYLPCSGNEKNKTSYSSFSPITWKWLITICESINLKFVLNVPKLAYNLMSISKLIKDYNYCVSVLQI